MLALTSGMGLSPPEAVRQSIQPPGGGTRSGSNRPPALLPEVSQGLGPLGGVTSQMVSLWMDLVRQAFPAAAPAPQPALAGLTSRQLNALDCISQEELTMTQLARALRVTESCATALADRLFAVGAISRERDPGDRRLVRVAATEVGRSLAAGYRRDLEAALERLLDQLEPTKLTAVTLAMSQLGDRDRARPAEDGQVAASRTEDPS